MDDKNEWIEIISKLKNEFSQILYLIYYLYNINQINKDQKLFLKNLVLLNTSSIFILLNNLKKTKNINDFSISIKKLITETNIKNTKIEYSNDEKKSKHIITISNNNSVNEDDNNNEDNDFSLEELKSPVNFLKVLYRK